MVLYREEEYRNAMREEQEERMEEWDRAHAAVADPEGDLIVEGGMCVTFILDPETGKPKVWMPSM